MIMKQNKIEKVISALLSYHPTIKEVAKNLKMAESMLYNYLKAPHFHLCCQTYQICLCESE